MAHPTLSHFFKRLGFFKRDDDEKNRNPLFHLHKHPFFGTDMEPDSPLGGEEELNISYKGRKCALASALAWVLLALCSASFLYLGKSMFPFKICGGPPHPHPMLPPPPMMPMPDKVDLDPALKALDDATSDLLRTWDGVSSRTQFAFKENFIPRGALAKPGEAPLEGILEGTPRGALAVYLHHVGTVKFLAEVVKRGRKEKRKAALLKRIKMVKTIVQLATQRLRGLDESGNFAVNSKIYSAVNGVDLELPSADELNDPEGEQTNYEEYQEMVKGIGTFRTDAEPAGRVPWPLAKKLVDTLRLKEMLLHANQDIISTLQFAVPFIYGDDGDWTDEGTGPVKGILLGPYPEPQMPAPGQGVPRGPFPAPEDSEGPTDMQGGAPPPGMNGGGPPPMPPSGHDEGLTEVPMTYFRQLVQKFAYLGIEEMGRLQRERRLPAEWNTDAALDHLTEINNSQKEYLDATNGLRESSHQSWEAELGELPPYDLAVVAISLM